jgi:uncharacterized protein
VKSIGWIDALERSLGRLAAACFRHAFAVLLATVAVTTGATLLARRLIVTTDLTELLPASFESVKNVRALTQTFGGVGYVTVIAEGASAAELIAFAERAAPELEALPTVRYVDYRKPVEFFEDHALYFMDRPDLETVRDRMAARRDWEVAHKTGIELEETEPPPVDLSDLEDKYRDKARFDEGKKGVADSRYYLDQGGKRIAILVRPRRLASDLTFARQVVGDVERVLSGMPRDELPAGLHWELTGRYKKRVDLQAMLTRDLSFASIISLGLVLAYVAFHFRRPTGVAVVLVPMLVGLALTYGFAAAAIGSLNIITAFIGAILLGIGVDTGIHLLGRFDEARATGDAPERAVQVAFGEAGRASLAAVVTNVGAFLCLTIAEFKAFREFGVLAAAGMTLTFVAYVVVMPCLLGVIERLRRRPADVRDEAPLLLARSIARWSPWLFWGLALLGFLALTRLPETRFNYDFATFDDGDLPSFRLDKEVNTMLGRSQTPLVVLARDEGEARVAAAALRERKERAGASSTIDRVVTIADLVPLDQAQKKPLLEEIGRILRRLDVSRLDEKQRSRIDDAKRMAAAGTFTRTELPDEVKRQFVAADGRSLSNFVLVYPSVSMSDGRMAQKLSRELSGLRLGDGRTVAAAGEPMVLADILDSVTEELPTITVLALLQQVVMLTLLLGGAVPALLALVPAVVSLPVTLALLPWVGGELNYLNVILLPTLLGMGEDGGAHLVSRVTGGDKLEHALAHTGRATIGASVTTAFGFGAMIVASHPGLRSFGWVAVLGLGVNLVACLFFLPALLGLIEHARETPPRWAALASTVGRAGLAPAGRGTLGALLSLPLAWALRDAALGTRIGVAVGLSAFAILAADIYARRRPEEDPQEVVSDEFVGCLVAVLMVPWSPWAAVGAFGLFRVLDIWKPWPIYLAERHLRGGLGIVADDLVAGVGAGGLVLAAQHIALLAGR